MRRILFLTCCLIMASCLGLSHQAWAKRVHGVFRVVKGDVKVKDSKGKVSRARVGQKVFPKDTIITAKDSRAKIVMVDKNIINVSPETQMVFQNYEYEPQQKKKNVLLNVIYGKVRSKVNQKYNGKTSKFQIKTPSAVAGVRGTDFFTSFNQRNQMTRVVTFEGEVKYGLPGRGGEIVNAVSVRAGQVAQNLPGRAPDVPKALPKSELANLNIATDAEAPDAIESPREPADYNQDGSEPPPEGANQEGSLPPPPEDGLAPQPTGETAMLPPPPDGDVMLGGDSMLLNDDLAGTTVQEPVFRDPASNDVVYEPPPIIEVGDTKNTDIRCDFCEDTIRDSQTNLIISIINQ